MSMNQLEKRVQAANLGYRKKKLAIINKVEVPIMVTNEGLIPKASTVDFTGIYKKEIKVPDHIDPSESWVLCSIGQGIAFDAKETQNKNSFPLSNIKQHQLLFLEYFEAVGGIAFFLIHFKRVHQDKAFVTPIDFVSKFWYDESSRRSLPYTEFDPSWLVDIDNYLSYFQT
jgi:recombination protein U